MEHLKVLFLSTKSYTVKLFTDQLFYYGGIFLGSIFWLTGLSIESLYSLLVIIFLDIFTRCWAERKNKRKIISKKMLSGFVGKITTYMILFTLANHAFMFSDIFSYVVLGGFVLVESWSIIENLEEVGMNIQVKFLKERIEDLKKIFIKKE